MSEESENRRLVFSALARSPPHCGPITDGTRIRFGDMLLKGSESHPLNPVDRAATPEFPDPRSDLCGCDQIARVDRPVAYCGPLGRVQRVFLADTHVLAQCRCFLSQAAG